MVYEVDCRKVTKGIDNVGECYLLAGPSNRFGACFRKLHTWTHVDICGAAQTSEPIHQLKKAKRPSKTKPNRSSTLLTHSA